MQAKGESALMSHSGNGMGRGFAKSLRQRVLASLHFAIAGGAGATPGSEVS
jgi:hypothetical protein